jgi:SH3-like domain-containing protein
MRNVRALALIAGLSLALGGAEAQVERKPPYWASIAAGKALMRTGPGRNYPATWLYQRADLPVRVVATYPNWRKVEDPDGATGWMLQHLLSDRRTALIRGPGARPIYEQPEESSKLLYRAEPGVVGRISGCGGGWCRFAVGGRQGYLRIDRVWGVEPNETMR